MKKELLEELRLELQLVEHDDEERLETTESRQSSYDMLMLTLAMRHLDGPAFDALSDLKPKKEYWN